ncbi:hypothetical protein BJ508DRAFT_348223 [Ascobolus immersus RN42]|uniref:Uncharacterized protein n=1 Tax=Ascobolus immersus RN42 TaxID=1160509 RepID=A0A3N4I024_ASCIM|nr:hypothetical protein BJ508DRAFT_348223 [Ascobolus immersus RN42]
MSSVDVGPKFTDLYLLRDPSRQRDYPAWLTGYPGWGVDHTLFSSSLQSNNVHGYSQAEIEEIFDKTVLIHEIWNNVEHFLRDHCINFRNKDDILDDFWLADGFLTGCLAVSEIIKKALEFYTESEDRTEQDRKKAFEDLSMLRTTLTTSPKSGMRTDTEAFGYRLFEITYGKLGSKLGFRVQVPVDKQYGSNKGLEIHRALCDSMLSMAAKKITGAMEILPPTPEGSASNKEGEAASSSSDEADKPNNTPGRSTEEPKKTHQGESGGSGGDETDNSTIDSGNSSAVVQADGSADEKRESFKAGKKFSYDSKHSNWL